MRPHTNSGSNTSTSTGSRHRPPSLSSRPSSKRSDGSQSTHTDSALSAHHHHHTYSSVSNPGSDHSRQSSISQHGIPVPAHPTIPPISPRYQKKPVKSQYAPNSTEKHVEYILVASFDIDRGSVMEQQYPGPVGGDEHMLAELMLPDQTHLRSQDWTIFFLHKDAVTEEEEEEGGGGGGGEDGSASKRRKRKKRKGKPQADGQADGEGEEVDDDAAADVDGADAEDADREADEANDDGDDGDGPPLVYVLNLVNTKQDSTVKRGAVVKAMAICTRHSFLHIYKPLLLLALEQYFANPVLDTLASLYDAVNNMDLSLMPKLSSYERFILQSSDAKDLFVEKFEAIIAQRMSGSHSNSKDNPDSAAALPSPTMTTTHQNISSSGRGRYGLPRDTHEFESLVRYANVPVPVKIPVALSAETVGSFSLIKLITTFSTPHATSPIPFQPTHPHLTTSGPLTHPIILLLNALLTQKRIIFLGHNLPSSDVADAVLAACALASGFGLLRGFTRHAFPYTDLTKIDDLLKVPGFIAGVTNPAFAHKPEWWGVLCDLSTGRMRISTRIEPAPSSEGVAFFQQPNGVGPAAPIIGGAGAYPAAAAGAGGGISALAASAGASFSAGLGGTNPVSVCSGGGDATGDMAFMQSVLTAIHERHGENAIRSKFRRWVLRFTRLAAAFEETVYGASALQIQNSRKAGTGAGSGGGRFGEGGGAEEESVTSPVTSMKHTGEQQTPLELPPEVQGHGYVWASPQAKTHELAANATRIEGWRNTRSYHNFIQDLVTHYVHRPVKHIDLQHLHDKLAKLRLSPSESASIYTTIANSVVTDAELCQLLAVVVNGVWPDGKGANSSGGMMYGGLFYVALGLFHPKVEVREKVAELLGRVREHEAGRHFWKGVGRFVRMGWERVAAVREAREKGEKGENGVVAVVG